MSEVTFSLEKAKRDNVTGRVVREKDKARALDRSRETISGSKESPLSCAPTYGHPVLLLDDVPVSTGEKRPPPWGLPLGNDSVAHGLGLSHAPLKHIRGHCASRQGHVPVMGRLMMYTGSLTTCSVQTAVLLTSMPMNALMGKRESGISAFVV